MKRLGAACVVIVAACSAPEASVGTVTSDVQTVTAWQTTFAGPGGGVEYVIDVQVDAAGNTYALVSAVDESFVQKLDPVGNVLWRGHIASGVDDGRPGGLAVAPDGTAYVIANIFGHGASLLAFAGDGTALWTASIVTDLHQANTLRRTSDGTLLVWTDDGTLQGRAADGSLRWTLPGFQIYSNAAFPVTVGNVVYALGHGTSADEIRRVTSAGAVQWTVPATGLNFVADAAGRLAVIGSTFDAAAQVATPLVKVYDASGALAWTYAPPEGTSTPAQAGAFDSLGNLWIGEQELLVGHYIVHVLGFAPGGTPIASEPFDLGQYNWLNSMTGLVGGGVLVNGTTDGSSLTITPPWIAVVDHSGVRWTSNIDGPGAAVALGDGGFVEGGADGDAVVTRFTASGASTWSWRYDEPAHAQDDYRDVSVAPNGDVFGATLTSDDRGTAGYVVKYDASGTLQWASTQSNAFTMAATAIGDGGAYVAIVSRLASPEQCELDRLDAQGNTMWRTPLGASLCLSVTLDPAGNAIVVVRQAFDGPDLVYSVTPAGSVTWQTGLTWGAAQKIAIDQTGILFVGGYFGPNVNKLTPSGAIQWQVNVPSPSYTPYGAALTPQGNAIAMFSSNEGWFVDGFASDGTLLWTYSSPTGIAQAIAVDPMGRTIVVGVASDESSRWVQAIDIDGTAAWRDERLSTIDTAWNALCVDTLGRVTAVGWDASTATNPYYPTFTGEVATFDRYGQLQWSATVPGAALFGCGVDAAGNPAVSGTLYGNQHDVVYARFLSAQALTTSPADVGFGSVNAGTTATQALTLKNVGGRTLTISGATVTGTGFALAATTFPIQLAPGATATVNVTFTPTANGAYSGTLTIASDYPEQPQYTVGLAGSGLLTPQQQVQNTINFFDSAVASGQLTGSGSGSSASGRLGALRSMIVSAYNAVQANDLATACTDLASAYARVDGQSPPPDFATGPDAAQLAAEIKSDMQALGCP